MFPLHERCSRDLPRLALALIALCSCTHAAPRRPAPTPVREDDRALVAATTLLDVARGDELLQLAAAIPPALRRPLAFHLLRTRTGQCNKCLDQPVTEIGALASPCTRDQVIEILLAGSPAHAAFPHDILRAAATTSDQLVATLGDQVPTDQLMELWSALDPAPQDRGWRVQALAERLSANQVAALFRSRPSTALLPVLDPIRDADLLIATATDRSSPPRLRAAAARRLRDADRTHAVRLLAMYRVLAADPDCDVAAAAIEGLRWLGVPSALPVAPQTTSAATLLHTVCVAAKTDVGDSGYQADMYRT